MIGCMIAILPVVPLRSRDRERRKYPYPTHPLPRFILLFFSSYSSDQIGVVFAKWICAVMTRNGEARMELTHFSATPMDRPSSSSAAPNGGAAPGFSAETVSSMLGNVKFDPATYRAVLPARPDERNLEYLYIDDPMPFPTAQPVARPTGSWGPLPMRTDGDKLLYGTGAAYMTGLGAGGFYGFVKGLQHPNATTFKLKINSVLNMCTRYGPWGGNNSGVMGVWPGVDAFGPR